MFGEAVIAGGWHSGASGSAIASDMSAAAEPVSTRVMTLPASSVASAVPASAAAPAETSNPCDRVGVAISSSKQEQTEPGFQLNRRPLVQVLGFSGPATRRPNSAALLPIAARSGPLRILHSGTLPALPNG